MEEHTDGLPFQARVTPSVQEGVDFVTAEEHPADDDWSLQALEVAYQRALEAADSVAEEAEAVASNALPETAVSDETPENAARRDAASFAEGSTARTDSARGSAATGVSSEKVLEALLFVGGDPRTGRRLADLLGGEHLHAQVDELIAGLDARYTEQCRPYQVQLGEGGYRLCLRPEFEPVRNRVYGLGPKDVRLSQDALEILALVAYQQPIGRDAIEATGKPNAASLLRQLLRLELIALERGGGGKDDITYRTTSRFLELFSIERLEDLPHPEDLMFR